MKITNLRAKEGFEMYQDENEMIWVKNVADSCGYRPSFVNCDFDAVQPEYKVGDVVKVQFFGDAVRSSVKGFVVAVDALTYRFAMEGSDAIWRYFKDDGHPESGWKIVGLWVEGEE